MKRGFITKIRNQLKSVEFGKDTIELIVSILKVADEKKLDPFHFDLQNSILIPLEEKYLLDYTQIRKIIDKDIHENWLRHKEAFNECGFTTIPTVKGFISCIMLKLK